MENVLIQAFYRKAKEEAAAAKNLGLPVTDLLLYKMPTLVDGLPKEAETRFDYIIVLINPADPTCFDQAEREFSRIEPAFVLNRRIELCLYKVRMERKTQQGTIRI